MKRLTAANAFQAPRPKRRSGGAAGWMMMMCAILAILSVAADTAPPAGEYIVDFEQTEAGKLPDDFLVTGNFAVKDFEGNQVLELPGSPLEHYGVLFGPAEHAQVEVRAKVWASQTGKRYPEFGIGAGNAFGYRLLLLPRQKKLVLRKQDLTVASAPYDQWKTDTWTEFSLRVEQQNGAWTITGQAAPAGDPDAGVTVKFKDKEEAPAGRGSIWGTPFSDKPIRFDDLHITTTPAEAPSAAR